MAYFSYHGQSIYFEERGQGLPVLFLHGNTASSKMFEPVMPLYEGRFHCVFIDFLGYGRSERAAAQPADQWLDQAGQAIALIEHLGFKKAGLVGTSGGAWAAMNAGLLRPDLVSAVVADSFDGRSLHDGFAKELAAERMAAKQNDQARGFYEWCQGPDWEAVVDRDTEALLRRARMDGPLFVRPLERMEPPVLLMGSKEDGMCRRDLAEEYGAMAAALPAARVRMFEHGGHPALASNAVEAAEAVARFLDGFPERLGRRAVYESDWVCLYLDTVRMPDGSVIPEYHRLHYPHDSVCVVVMNERGEVLMTKSKRYTTGRLEWELPAGRVEAGETPGQAARRECLEETGRTLDELTFLFSQEPLNGMCDLTVHVFLGKVSGQEGDFDSNEVSLLRWVKRGRALDMVRANEMRCGVSMLAVLYALTFGA